jgi:hypothetical protein
MFNFRPMTGLPGFRVGQTEDTPGFAVDPNGLPSPYDPNAAISDGYSLTQVPLRAPPALRGRSQLMRKMCREAVGLSGRAKFYAAKTP